MSAAWLWPTLTIALVCACACLPASQVHERAFWRQRDLALLGGCALAAVGALAAGEAWLAPLALWAVVRWRSSATLPSVVVWASIAALWLLATTALRTPAARSALAVALIAVAVAQVGIALSQRWDGSVPTRRAPRGTFGQRTLLAAYLAMTVPLALVWPNALFPAVGTVAILLAGLVLTTSWVAGLAVLAAGIVLAPTPGLLIAALVAAALASVLVVSGAARRDVARGNRVYHALHMGSVRHRWRTWTVTLRLWPTSPMRLAFGAGPGELQYDLLRWTDRYKANLITGYAHSEPVQLVYEYGLCGAAALALFVWRVAPGLAIGDPWSAAAVAGAVCACGSITCRTPATGVPWLAVCAVVAARSAT